MDFEKLRHYRNTANLYAVKEGIHVDEIRLGYARASKTTLPDDLNPAGLVQGGNYFTLADVACGAAAASHGFHTVTLNATYNYFRSVRDGVTIIAEATEIKSGKTIRVFDVQVKDQDGTLLGAGTFTCYTLDKPFDL